METSYRMQDVVRDRTQLLDILARQSLEVGGHYKLASGTTSSVYVDGKIATFSAVGMPIVGRVFVRKLAECGWSPKAVGGRTIGADPIAYSIARESGVINAFSVRKDSKEHGINEGPKKYIAGIRTSSDLPVVIVDDVCTAGTSTGEAIEKARNAGMIVLGAICLVDRQQGARELLSSKYQCRLESIFTLPELIAHYEQVVAIAEPVGAPK